MSRDRESGQAVVEFALILFPLLLIVVGVIQFGIGLNYWLDMQRIANQGARWGAVNCARAAQTPPSFNPCSPSLEQTLKEQALSAGLENNVCVWVSYPSKVVGGSTPYPGNKIGDPIMVRLESEIDLLPIMGVGSLKLGADATMRMEQEPNDVPEGTTCP
jgi:TadE-like protein